MNQVDRVALNHDKNGNNGSNDTPKCKKIKSVGTWCQGFNRLLGYSLYSVARVSMG